MSRSAQVHRHFPIIHQILYLFNVLQEKEQRAKDKLLLKQQEEQLKLQEQKRKEAEREQKRK